MSLVELLQQSAGMRMVDEDGNEDALRLLPPASPAEIEALEAALPCPIPTEVRELLALTPGFANGPIESVDFGGPPDGFGMEAVCSDCSDDEATAAWPRPHAGRPEGGP